MIINTLKLLMEDNSYSQTRINEKTGITRPTLLSLIRNENKSIKYDVIDQLCKLFNIYMNDLLLYSPIEMNILDFDYFTTHFEEREKTDLDFSSNVKIDDETYNFEHEILDISNKEYESYIVDMTAYVEYETFLYLTRNNVIPILNTLIRLRENYQTIIEDINYLLNNDIYNPSFNVEIHYRIDIKKDDVNLLIKKIDSLPENEKRQIKNHLNDNDRKE